MSLGEAAQIMSPLGIQLQYYNFNMGAFGQYPELGTAPCLPDRILLPGERAFTLRQVYRGAIQREVCDVSDKN